MKSALRITTPQQLTELRDRLRAEQAAQTAAGHKQVRICMGAGCIASGAEQVKQSIEAELPRSGVRHGVSVVGTGCLGPCSAGPTLMIDDVFYENVKPQDGTAWSPSMSLRGQVVARLTHRRRRRPQRGQRRRDGFLQAADEDRAAQLRRDRSPADRGLHRPRRLPGPGQGARRRTPDEVIETMRISGLRGRGGAGFPTWRKWKLTRESAGDAKYAVCNADEGDPGRVHGPQRAGGRPP